MNRDTLRTAFQAVVAALLALLLSSVARLDSRIETLSAVATKALIEASEANAKLETMERFSESEAGDHWRPSTAAR